MGELDQALFEITRRFAEGDIDGAFAWMADLERECETDRQRAQVMARYASLFHLLDLRDEGLAAIARALALDPCNPRARYLNAVQFMIDERWDEAITELNRAARYYPPDDSEHLAEVYGNLSYCWDQLGDTGRAEMYEEICADLDPDGMPAPEAQPRGAWPDGFEVPVEMSPFREGEGGGGDGDASSASGAGVTGSELIDEMVRDLMPKARRRSCRRQRTAKKARAGARLRGAEGDGNLAVPEKAPGRGAGVRPSPRRKQHRSIGRGRNPRS